jgi:hypothetical protein
MAMAVRGDHDRLQLLGERLFEAFEPGQVVTFLNQTLKGRGLIFGVRRVRDGYELMVYDALERPKPDA